MKKVFFLFFFLFSVTCIIAQPTKVTGTIKDALTFEPVPFTNISFKGTSIGTTSDMDGKFSIETSQSVDTILASFIGFLPVAMPVVKKKTQVIHIVMKANKYELPEIVIRPGKNPAITLLEKIIENKSLNDPEKLEAYQCEVYNKVEFDINDITEKFKTNKVMKPFAKVFTDYIDTNSTNKKPFLPVFISESISDFYYRKTPKAQKEIIKASKVSGMENPTITQFLGDMYQGTNIYDNFIVVFGKNFVSPIASVGQLYYKYYLVDSAFIGNKWCYKVSYQPRRKQEFTFVGDFWVNDTTFAIKKVTARIAEDANLNYIEDLAVVKEYTQIGTQWTISKDIMVADFSLRDEGMSFIGRKNTSYKNFIINQPLGNDFFLKGDNIIVDDSAYSKTSDFWDNARHDTLNEREQKIYQMVDTIKAMPVFKTWINIITLFITGYKEVGIFEFGPYFTFFSFNAVEGPRFRIGGRTGNKFSTDLVLSSYVAYGTRDGRFKYSGGAQYYLSKKPRNSIGYFHKNDVEQLGQSENAFQDDNILTSVFRRSPTNKLTRLEENKAYYEYEWYPGFSSKLTFTHRFYQPIRPLDYSYYPEYPDTLSGIKNSLNTSEISFYTRFAYREKFIAGKVDRVSIGTKYPVLQLNYVLGLKGTLGSDFAYHKAMVNLHHYFYVGAVGWTQYTAEAGKVWGRVPYPLLEVHQGNESYAYDYLAFNLMNYFEFVSDNYASLSVTHHFDGLYLNRIPLMRKLKWRELLNVKGVVGGFSKQNEEILLSKNSFSTLSKPYLEASAGIENIFKIIRIDAVWRINYIDKNYVKNYESLNTSKISPFGIRGSFYFTF